VTNQPLNPPNPTFFGLGIAPRLLETIGRLKYTVPTPIQLKAIPVAVEGKDVIGVAQTGTGKTLAFGIPMIQRLAQVGGQGLVLLPTRELALQVDEVMQLLGRSHGLRTVVIIGGAAMGRQIEGLSRHPHIIVATPGRLNDHLMQRTVNLNGVKILVLDEADRMLDMGFAPQIIKILKHLPRQRQTMLFSATMPAAIVGLARNYMQLPVQVEIAPSGTAAAGVSHELFFTQKEQKTRLLAKLLERYRGTVLVFTRTKHGARKLERSVTAMGHQASSLHSDRTLAQRRQALDGFKSGRYRVLVATDIAARGIDVSNIELVVNYDLPGQPEDYIHRIGRTGRANRQGRAISFATPDQYSDVRSIEKLLKKTLPVSHLPELPPEQRSPAHPSAQLARPTAPASGQWRRHRRPFHRRRH